MTLHNAQAAIITLGILAIVGGLLWVTKTLAGYKAAETRRDEAWHKSQKGRTP